ncbi:type II toxin-antitoxin system VapC family toxin [Flavobacterium magnesitis]|uniref:type II toxin-antitoxin system VapC family toxin n=1 Tax=Flavobacterium magnesitis TaxID=3138077 RepID=UPI00358DE735
MDKILVDTNIVLDLLSKREEFYQEAQELFTLSDHNNVKLYVSSLSIANIHYILSRNLKLDEARKILIKFKVLVEVLPMDDKILELALVSDFKDFEDAIQYHTALENELDLILTRNKKDFKKSVLPVFTAKEYLKK